MEGLRALLHASTWRFAWRNAGRNRQRTAIVVVAVAVGVGGMLLTMAVNFGMIFGMVRAAIEAELGHVQAHAPGFSASPAAAHIPAERVPSPAQLDALPGAQAWAPRLIAEGLIFSPRASTGIRLEGVDPVREARVTSLASSLVAGEWLAGTPRRVVIGARLAERLQVGVGDRVVISVQDASGDVTGEAVRVAGLFRSASRELDESVVLADLAETQQLLGLDGAISELVVRGDRNVDVGRLRDALAALLPADYDVRTWRELRPVLVGMIEVFDQTGWATYAAVFVAMAFGIANVLLMSVYERIRELGILLAIGMPPARLVAGIVLEGWLLTSLGLLLGVAGGAALVFALRDGIDLSSFSEGLTAYGIPPRIVPVVRPIDLAMPVAVALVTAVLASLWPALRIVRIRPADALRRS